MKKILPVLFIFLAIFCFVGCATLSVQKPTDDESAMDAVLFAMADTMKKDGSIIEGDFSFETEVLLEQLYPMNIYGNFSAGSTISPTIATKMSMDLFASMAGMEEYLPAEIYLALNEDKIEYYIMVMDLWLNMDMPELEGMSLLTKDFVEFSRSEENLEEMNKMMRTGSFAKFNGVTKVKEEKVFDVDIYLNENFGSAVLEYYENIFKNLSKDLNMEDVSFEQDKEILETMKTLGSITNGLSFKVYLREKDCSLFGISMDVGTFLNGIMKNTNEILMNNSESNLEGYINIYYLKDEQKKPIVIPEEVKNQAISADTLLFM